MTSRAFSTTRRVEFRDTDAAGIVHFSAFFPMMESAEHELLRSLGIPVMPPRHLTSSQSASLGQQNHDAVPCVTWPRVSAKCDYRSAARFEDVLMIDVLVSKLGTSSVEYSFRFHRSDSSGDEVIAVGSIVAVCCRLDDSGLAKMPISVAHREKLQAHVASSIE